MFVVPASTFNSYALLRLHTIAFMRYRISAFLRNRINLKVRLRGKAHTH